MGTVIRRTTTLGSLGSTAARAGPVAPWATRARVAMPRASRCTGVIQVLVSIEVSEEDVTALRGIDTWVGLLHRGRLASSVMRRTVPSVLFVLVAALVPLALSACGDDSDGGDGAEGATTKPKVEVPSG